jgi:mono/diheme cytochrome c family protein
MRNLARSLLFLGLAMVAAAVIAACKSIPPPTPLAQLNPQQTSGYYIFQQHCAQCHADRTNDLVRGPALRSIFKKEYLSNGQPANDDRVISIILYGYGTMPALGNTMAPSERDDLLAYLHSL